MKFSSYSNTDRGSSAGLFPLLTSLVLLMIHFLTGALDWPAAGDIRAQRDFNSAIGMSALTGYFWFALRLMQQNVASTLVSLLVRANRLSHFTSHRDKLTSHFKHQIFNAMILSIMITVVYCVFEGLISVKQELHVLMLTATAVPFWFIALLFLFQMSSNINYLKNKVMPSIEANSDRLNSLSAILSLGTTNSIFAVGALAIFPIFWLKKDIPIIDVLVVSSFTATVLIFLFLPVIKLRRSLESEQNKLLNELENDIAEGIRQCALDNGSGFGKNIEQMESEKETLSSYRFRAFSPRDKARIAACITLIPVSWLVLLLTEWLIHLTYY
ncbi:hypothetical protein [Alteromonas sp. 009811495]|uniref:hypothetical protein n=1 Tax=Alteromonas sp. 009811495 TaxID=3002962 RepID=UPI00237EC30F|nr:hypothetical protein [Alteromonas sp. 009811495]WDT86140.1 hypothetical protein OZ660_19755 [Alteromonas sp. 009811495]